MAVNSRKSENGDDVLEPLILPSRKIDTSADESPENSLTCLFCDETFSIQSDPQHNRFIHHLFKEHKFVIDKVKLIADFKSYIEYWRKRFGEGTIVEFCPVIKTNSEKNSSATSEYFYLLCDVLPEDKAIREKLQKQRLEYILNEHQKERNDTTFKHSCLFCKKVFKGNRADLFSHMVIDHNFNIGHSDNIVFGNEFLNILQEKLESLQCLYCEKIFKNWSALKEHMRKKQHKRIRPDNTSYDKFYLINYLESGKSWETIQNESDFFIKSPVEDSDEEWRDWEEESTHVVCLFCDFTSSDVDELMLHMNKCKLTAIGNWIDIEWRDWEEESTHVVCLFCDFTSSDVDELMLHMNENHKFDFDEIKTKFTLNFYEQVKLINYIRKQMHQQNCFICNKNFTSRKELNHHMIETGHISSIPSKEVWDQPKYYFPTYENDNLLCCLDDGENFQCQSLEPPVLPEELEKPISSILLDENVRKLLIQ
ncbi:zinc finger protein 277-like [Centruroides sculpturatus]|uniref:zinc finger protein 277-like n=1 Tax=Centruroides sculpturatus TaxID=218467 RepID=UPI000C6DDEF4|nr:zinc finger protein 277-like [Centruroides sculpturatus]